MTMPRILQFPWHNNPTTSHIEFKRSHLDRPNCSRPIGERDERETLFEINRAIQ